ncbi:hypothetical protein CPT_Sycamore_026 [Streptomyces phage Sycamore]|uniref:Uncharacterized protein n=1 Tax=Streptomyces phage Sycamore TaxID=2767589 RepID=A0A873WJA7_9CAUD|nr:hypothetical protein CPT_Sycamore_026 [Streptomyces phage Sycamore]
MVPRGSTQLPRAEHVPCALYVGLHVRADCHGCRCLFHLWQLVVLQARTLGGWPIEIRRLTNSPREKQRGGRGRTGQRAEQSPRPLSSLKESGER